MNQMTILRMEGHYVQFTFVATLRALRHANISAHKVASVFIPFRNELLQVIHVCLLDALVNSLLR
jgi:hypothetical protein